MIINRFEEIRPKRYRDTDLRVWVGDALGKASADEFLAAWILAQESMYARSIVFALHQHAERMERELQEAQRRSAAEFPDTPEAIAKVCQSAARQLVIKFAAEYREAEQALEEGRTLFREMRNQFGLSPTFIYEKDRELAASEPTPIETLMPLWQQLCDAEKRVDKLLATDLEELHQVALLDYRRMAFIRSEASVSLDMVAELHHSEFEQLAADLLRRDGHEILRQKGGAGDLGADVIAKAPDGKILVVQCKHTAGSATVGSPALQRLNGTAKPVHNADIVIAMTNGGFSLPARRFAANQGIFLIEAKELEHWATWGQPLQELLEKNAREMDAA